ncbi:trypsin-like serine peptidase [Mammaliicoccus vitulinus]|nr:trypsin-like serine protease [Mammaliicoccus vitulinus]
MGKYIYSIVTILLVLCLSFMFQVKTVHANETQLPNQNKVLEQNNKDSTPQSIVKKDSTQVTSKVVSNQKIQPKSQVTTTKKVQSAPTVVQNQKPQNTSTAVTNHNTQTSSQAVINKTATTTKVTKPKAAPVKKKKAQTLSTTTKSKPTKTVVKKAKTATTTKVTKPKAVPVKKKKAQTLSTSTKSKPSKTVVKKAKTVAKPTKNIKPKVTPKVTKKKTTKTTKTSYYNKAPKAWSSKIPGSDNVRDFGQSTNASGINDALKIMKSSGNKGVTINHTTPKAANIATIFNWNPKAKTLTYGTGTAIGKHTILTANHVINNPQAHKPMTPSSVNNLRINLLQQGLKAVRTLNVTGVKMMKYGDVALLYTKEDISKYMKIRKIAPEKSITNIKANTPIHMYHYGLPTGKYKKDPMGTMYYSKGKYSLMARNVNPIGYYQMMAEPGSSGGAILNSKNEVLGVHAFRIDSGDFKKYHLNTMAELRGKLRKEILKYIL